MWNLVVRLSREDVLGAFRALESIDYHPLVPISAEDFADSELRERWRTEKGMRVLKFWSDRHRETPLDVFVYEPFDFALEEAAAFRSGEPRFSGGGIRFHSCPGRDEARRGAAAGSGRY